MLRLGPAEREALAEGARALGVELEPEVVDRLDRYAALLDRWSTRTNLISCRDGAELVDRHLLDSLALVPLIVAGTDIADLGSGAGLPGIPLAVARPYPRVVLVEARRRRASFLRTVRGELGREGLEVREQRADEEPRPGGDGFGAVVCRAVWSDETALRVAANWLAAGGRFFWMRHGGRMGTGATGGLALERVHEYRIGGSPTRQIWVFGHAGRSPGT
jgi:16S rRNA (guanine527-N7)-methyltransferase